MTEHSFLIGLIALGILSVIIFNFVAFFGAPFLPTRRNRIAEAVDLLDLRPGQTLLELGSGDGRLLKAAAQRGIVAIGYELNPVLVLWSRWYCWPQRKLVTVRLANYWQLNLPPADGMYVFLLQPYMAKLDAKIRSEVKQPIKLVSFAFSVPGRKPQKSLNGLYLYEYPQRTG